MQGYGIYRWNDGRVYYGERKEGMKDGFGYFKDRDGIENYGLWKNDKRHGDAVLIKNG
jgi:hypothetical protein